MATLVEPSQAARRGPSPTVDRAAAGQEWAQSSAPSLRRARATAKRAPGCDGWAGKHWNRLPEQFFHSLAEVWNSTLDGASIPAAWTQVRIYLIPKGDGGLRPLAIAALVWHLGAACLVQLLGDWIGRVFPEELYGGLPGKSVDDVHAELTHDLYDSTCSVAVGLWLVARLTSGSVLTALPLTWRSTAFGRSGLHRLFWT